MPVEIARRCREAQGQTVMEGYALTKRVLRHAGAPSR